ncbi:MAG TPA: GDSL-type esterase/lipase family protein [Tepidisphaeraceae bacterium]|jgi:acyl-CoA thioesterase-1|nr:GDSL-type esterase/lipase family protein [Tepidisphaeraceae bacterium]
MRDHFLRAISSLILSLALAATACAADAPSEAKLTPEIYHRTVFLGDSITDGNTYPQLVRDAFAQAKLPKMIAINAGIGGDTAAGMLARLDRDVLVHQPTLVTFSAGANDALHGVTPEAYERDVRAIVRRMKKEKVTLILLTPNVLGPKQQAKGRANLDAYETILRKIAKEDGLRIAEVNRRQKQDAAAGRGQLAPDDLHPNWNGQTMIARAVLDAMGYDNVAVPDHISNEPVPGVIPQWRIKRLGPKDAPLSEAVVATIKPDDSWQKLALPETTPIPDFDANNRWLDDYRTLGASVSLRQQPGGGKYLGVAIIKSDKAKAVTFTTGGELQQIWLNGKQIYQNDWKHGYHIGRESVKAELKPGENQVVIATGAVFFVSVE